MSPVTIVSFGYLHGGPPPADVTVDLRPRMRDPHDDPAMRELTGADPAIRARVKGAPGAAELLGSLAMVTRALLPSGAVTLALGCAGGRHRSYVLAEWLAFTLRFDGVGVEVVHRDVHLPVVRR